MTRSKIKSWCQNNNGFIFKKKKLGSALEENVKSQLKENIKFNVLVFVDV